MRFDLKQPCDQCPFRADVKPFLTASRAKELTGYMQKDKTFPCHKIAHGNTKKRDWQHCAGAEIMTVKEEIPNAMLQIAQRLGIRDESRLKLDSPVYDSFKAMEQAYNNIN